jgi:DNA-binding transcriptional LysR family regulator
MNFNQLRYVVAVDEKGSVSKAAQHLFVSQPAISTAIKELEKEIGISIFTRSTTGMSITEDGAGFIAYARSIIDQFDDISSKYANTGNDLIQTFSVSAQPIIDMHKAIIDISNSALANKPNFSLTIKLNNTSEVIEDVSLSRSDIGIIFTLSGFDGYWRNLFLTKRLGYFPFSQMRHLYIVMGINHPMAKREILDMLDMKDYIYMDAFNGNPSSVTAVFENEVRKNLGVGSPKKSVYLADYLNLIEVLSKTDFYAIIASTSNKKNIYIEDKLKGFRLNTTTMYAGGIIKRAQRKFSPDEQNIVDAFSRSLI